MSTLLTPAPSRPSLAVPFPAAPAPLPYRGRLEAPARPWALPRRAALCALVAFTLAALALRLLLATRSGLWIDEAQLIWTIRFASVGDVLHFVANHDSHPPLFYLLMRGWLWAFGDAEAAAIAPGIILGVALVPALYLAGSRVFSPATGLVAAALAACSPLLAWHSAEVRPYSLMAMLCLVATLALWSALRDAKDDDATDVNSDARRPTRLTAWAVYVIATVAMLYTHNWAWLVWGGQGLAVLGWWALRGAGRAGWATVRAAVVAQLLVAAAAACWLPTLLHQAQHAGHGPAAVSAHDFAKVVSSLVFSFDSPGRVWAAFALLAVAGWRPLAGLARRVKPSVQRTPDVRMSAQANDDRGLGIALFFGAPLAAALAAAALSWRNNLLVPHSLTVVSPCLILAAACVIAGLPRLPARLAPGALGMAPTLLVAALVMVVHVEMLVGEPFVKSNAREVAAEIEARATADDLTLVLPQWYGSGFYYYYPIDRPRADHPVSDFNGAFPYDDVAARAACPDALARLKRQLLAARLAGRRVWVVTDRRWADLADGGQHPAHLRAGAYRKVAFERAAEIRAFLDTLYGPADHDAIPPDTRHGWSMMSALLYAPPATTPGTSSTFARVPLQGGEGEEAPVDPQASIADDR